MQKPTAKIKRKNEHTDFSSKYDASIENQAYLKRKDFF